MWMTLLVGASIVFRPRSGMAGICGGNSMPGGATTFMASGAFMTTFSPRTDFSPPAMTYFIGGGAIASSAGRATMLGESMGGDFAEIVASAGSFGILGPANLRLIDASGTSRT
jgi:hypothetical protein